MTTTTFTMATGATVTIETASEPTVSAGEVLIRITVTGGPQGLGDNWLEVSDSWSGFVGQIKVVSYGDDDEDTSDDEEFPVWGDEPYRMGNPAVYEFIALQDIAVADLEGLGIKVYEDHGFTQSTYDAVVSFVESETNAAPDNLALSWDKIGDASEIGTVVGTLSADDADGDELTFELVGDSDFFEVVGNELRLKSELDHETAPSHEVTVKVLDGNGGETTRTFTIGVTEGETNFPPTDISISNTTISESARTGSLLGILSATDPEGESITFTLATGQGDNGFFMLRTNEDGTTSVFLKSPLDFEGSQAVNGVYELVVDATDSAGNVTRRTLDIQSTDDPFTVSAVPTGKTYMGVVENAAVGTKIGYVTNLINDLSFVPTGAELLDNAGGKFSLVQSNGRYYLAVNGDLDYETQDSYSVTIKATGAGGVSHVKTFDVRVIDAAEAGDTARGTITIDANTALAGVNGGVDWNTYLDAAYSKVVDSLPDGVTFAPTTSSKYVYTLSDGSKVTLTGSDLAYWWGDANSAENTGEDVHVVGGTVEGLAFGNGGGATEVAISGLDLFNDSGLLNRIYGEANIMAAAWMHGPGSNTPAEILHVKAMLAAYAQHFKGSSGADTYTGTLFDDVIEGNGGKDVLSGGAGNDTINGGAGADTMAGGKGNDTFVVDSAGDVVTEHAGEGTDTVRASISYTLSANVENLALTGTGNISGKGNALANVLTGNAGNNTLDGGAGADRLAGGKGNDTYVVDNAGDVVDETGGSGTDTVRSSVSFSLANTARAKGSVENLTLTGSGNISGTGNGLANTLIGNGGNNALAGNAGNDTLDGGAGADTLTGGTGNDTYVVDNKADRVVERRGEGTDLVKASVSHTLADNVENLTLAGSGNISGTGNGLANTITGNAGNNVLDGKGGADRLAGGKGNDTYVVDNRGDKVVEASGQGSDLVKASVSYTLANHVEKLTLTGSKAINGTGNGLANTITGNAGNNVLDGKGGADRLAGGKGNDTYVVDNRGDKVVETSGQGTDLVKASVSYTLANHVEKLTLTGSKAINGTGNGLANTITGNAKANTLKGGAGNDTLKGGSGSDKLYGGTGRDTLDGGSGNDLLKGESGNDKLYGGAGADKLYGGSGKDTFVFKSVKESTAASKGRDTIYDFDGKAGDRIDLRSIDASTKKGGDQAFKFIGTDDFSKTAGELRYEKKASDSHVYGDVNGDGKADFAIHFDDALSFSKGYFLL
ncbi:hypothetical protein [Shinella pollutisoli]|uniref:Cadherin domain-containing protein n=1 Tax=Shinella pollutisoli TaxID=2250594 RepID=A0ABV7DG77_9HYPH|nr:hypothetical protein [Shinella pollutisoli]